MSLFRKKADPISDRARALNDEIAALESEIRRLDLQLHQDPPVQENPRLRSTALPHGATPHRMPELEAPAAAGPSEPIFEEVDQNGLDARQDSVSTRDHYNELGVRKYDLPALIQKIRNNFRGPATSNPRLVNYLAAGGIQGLRPLRYEKRVARNRFIVFVVFLLLVLIGLVGAFIRRH